MAQDSKISDLIQITEYDSSAIIPVVIDEGGVLHNRKIALTDIDGKDYLPGNGINITGVTISIDKDEIAAAGFLTGETDPLFNASVAKNITTGDIDNWNGKQEQLVSTENIKTINGISILGNGNLAITAEGSIAEGIGINISPENVISVDTTELATIFEPVKGIDDNYITDADKLKLDGISGTNTGDETADSIKTKLGITVLSGNNTGDQDLAPYLTITGAQATYSVTGHNHNGIYQPVMGSDDNYVTDAEKNKLADLSGVNTGDETASTIKTKLGIVTLSGSNTGDQDLNPYLTKTGATALYITGETDPIFNASVAKTITSGNITSWNNKVDQVAGKSLVSDIEISKLATYPNLSGTTTQYVRADGVLSEILIGSGGYAANIYLTSLPSTVNPLVNKLSYVNDATTSDVSASATNGNTLIKSYLFDNPVDATQIDAGSWNISTQIKVDSTIGNTRLMAEVYRRTSGGIESTLFTTYSPSIENTVYQHLKFETVQNYFIVDPTDYIGIRLYVTTDSGSAKTLSIQLGDSTASYINTPLAIRHSQLRAPNEDVNVQHMTAVEKTKLDSIDLTKYLAKSGDTITGNLNIVGNLTVTGSTFKTNVEEINVKSDYIKLRDGAVSGLGAGSYTGIEAVKYDGTNNGRLAFDNAGIARVGDVGTEQPIATREETPITTGIAVWNAAASRFNTNSNLVYDGTNLKVGTVNVSLEGHTHNYVPTTRIVNAGPGMTGGGALSGDISIAHADTSSASSITVANTGNNVLQNLTVSVDTYGHVTSTSSSSLDLGSIFALKSEAGGSIWKTIEATRVSNTSISATGNIMNLTTRNTVFSWKENDSWKTAIVTTSNYSAGFTTITFAGDTMLSIDAGTMRYCTLPPRVEKFVAAGTIATTGTNIANAFITFENIRVIAADLFVGTNGNTNNTTIDINKNGTSMFTTKPTLGNGVSYSPTQFKSDDISSMVIGDKVTIDIDGVQTTPAVDLYVNLYVIPSRYLYL